MFIDNRKDQLWHLLILFSTSSYVLWLWVAWISVITRIVLFCNYFPYHVEFKVGVTGTVGLNNPRGICVCQRFFTESEDLLDCRSHYPLVAPSAGQTWANLQVLLTVQSDLLYSPPKRPWASQECDGCGICWQRHNQLAFLDICLWSHHCLLWQTSNVFHRRHG